LISICNGILSLFSIDKKYYFLKTSLERLRSEGWQYFGLTGRYSGRLLENKKPTPANQFIYFMHSIEKIKMKQVEEEYYKIYDTITHTPHSTQATELYPPDTIKLQQISPLHPKKDAEIASNTSTPLCVEEVKEEREFPMQKEKPCVIVPLKTMLKPSLFHSGKR
jgi:hypothetical protein